MSLFAIIPPFMAVVKLLRVHWSESLLPFLKKLPDSFSDGVRFLLTGSPNPWLLHENRTLPSNPISISALEQYWPVGKLTLTLKQAPRPIRNTCTVCFVWLVANVADVRWIMACKLTDSGGLNGSSILFKDVKAGSIPNPRTPVNDPHSAWKPFSVASMQFLQIPDVRLSSFMCILQRTYLATAFAGSTFSCGRHILIGILRLADFLPVFLGGA